MSHASDLWNNIADINDIVGIGAGIQQIGSVTISGIKAGTAQIGSVTISNMQPLVAGVAQVGSVTISNMQPLVAGISQVGSVTVSNPLLAGTQQIGSVTVSNTPLPVEQQYNWGAFSSCSTVLMKSGAGYLHAINIGAISCPTIALLDALIPSGAAIARIGSGSPIGTYLYDVSLATGLTIDTSGGGVTQLLTISYR